MSSRRVRVWLTEEEEEELDDVFLMCFLLYFSLCEDQSEFTLSEDICFFKHLSDFSLGLSVCVCVCVCVCYVCCSDLHLIRHCSASLRHTPDFCADSSHYHTSSDNDHTPTHTPLKTHTHTHMYHVHHKHGAEQI